MSLRLSSTVADANALKCRYLCQAVPNGPNIECGALIDYADYAEMHIRGLQDDWIPGLGANQSSTVHTHIHVRTHTHAHTHTHTHAYARTNARTHERTNARMHARTHARIRNHAHIYIHRYQNIHASIANTNYRTCVNAH